MKLALDAVGAGKKRRGSKKLQHAGDEAAAKVA